MTPEQAERQAILLRGTDPSHLEAEDRVLFIEPAAPKKRGLAFIPLRYFRRLPEYSTSLPTGTRFGKLWRRKVPEGWCLGRYYDMNDPEHVGILWYRLQIAEVAILEALTDRLAG